MDFHPGDILTGSIFPEPVKMLACRIISPALTKIKAVGLHSKRYYDPILGPAILLLEDWKMKKDEVLKILQDVDEEIRQKYKARIKGIFGSLAKGKENTGSDVDILVEFEEGANLIHFVGLSLFLEEKIHLPVDLVPIDAIKEEIKGHVLKEAIYL